MMKVLCTISEGNADALLVSVTGTTALNCNVKDSHVHQKGWASIMMRVLCNEFEKKTYTMGLFEGPRLKVLD